MVKKWFNLAELFPAVAVGMAVMLGLQLSTPTLDKVVWPVEPNITVEAKEKEEEADAEQETEDASETEETEEEEVAAGVGNYTDGVFTGVGVGYGGDVKVQVTVKGKQITAIDILSNKDTPSFFNKAKDSIIGKILKAQTWNVDSVSGATYSSRGIKDAVCNALTGKVSKASTPKKVKPKTKLSSKKFVVGDWKDGTFTGTANGFGGKIRVSVTIKDGKITAIKVLSHSGETPSYYKRATAVIPRIIKKQTPNVDTVSGATYSSTGIREAVKNALRKAAGKKTSSSNSNNTTTKKKTSTQTEVKIPAGTPADGTYTGTAVCQQSPRFNYNVTVTAVFKAGKLVSVTMKTTDEGSNASYIKKAWDSLEKELLSDIKGDVDTVSRATYTSNAIKTAYKLAYKKAVEANGGTVDDTDEDSSDPSEDNDESSDTGDSADTEGGTDTGDSTDTEGGTDTEDGNTNVPKETGSGSNNGDASLSGSPADGSYKETVTVNANDADMASQRGWFDNYTISGKVTFKDGKLTAISSVSIEDAPEYDWDSDEYYMDKAVSAMITKLKNAQSNEVDTVSGATCSSKAIIALYEKAYKEAVAANKNQDSDTAEETDDAEKSAAGNNETPSLTAASEDSAPSDTLSDQTEDQKGDEDSGKSDSDKDEKDSEKSDDEKDEKDADKSDDKKDEKDADKSDDKKDEKDADKSDDKKDEKDADESDKKDEKDADKSDDKKDEKDSQKSDDKKDEKDSKKSDDNKNEKNSQKSEDEKAEK